MSISADFFTIGTMVTLSGATGATFVVCNGLQRAFDFNPRWLALLVAQIIVLAGVAMVSKGELLDYFVGIINGFLVFCSAAGATGALATQSAAARVVGRGNAVTMSGMPQTGTTRRRFLSAWF